MDKGREEDVGKGRGEKHWISVQDFSVHNDLKSYATLKSRSVRDLKSQQWKEPQ